ncbi:winged helix-turn-helix transcriptional regulator, partial [Alkalinema pantanalense CENA528]|uniref:winged helix-turn-helix transcriptional regulator n=1 Tax=Alkalinema pantanalense TaxID=1620705 RepID=UPI003D6E15E3
RFSMRRLWATASHYPLFPNTSINRSYESTIPPQVSYELTERGKELSKPLYDLCDLASRWYGDETTT